MNIYSPKPTLHPLLPSKKSTAYWLFLFYLFQRTLEKVSLLYNRDRLHFFLHVAGKACQIAQGETFGVSAATGQRLYRVRLQFAGGMFGSFQQWVIFDFGSEPVLCKKVTVEVGNQDAHFKVRNIKGCILRAPVGRIWFSGTSCPLTSDRWGGILFLVQIPFALALSSHLSAQYFVNQCLNTC